MRWPLLILCMGHLLMGANGSKPIAAYSLAELEALADQPLLSTANATNFYGKIINPYSQFGNFTAHLLGGTTNFYGVSPDLANIYVSAGDYDTWRQQADVSVPIRGEFTYEIRNETWACLIITVQWEFNVKGQPQERGYHCEAVVLASNWDCHLSWALTAQCDWEPQSSTVSAVYNLTNLGYDPGKSVGGRSLVVIQHGFDSVPHGKHYPTNNLWQP
eukprot:TRINITY_DN67190_c0_g1_i1.p1 TRINITY_DN67190_c0_g1~~TRINITY_DN67190_c0_g1_i1.p1  ORF type:complete len:225 (-),score=29.26 TRINITY_DN67190_c0_g1_i1:35-685(-)